MSRPGADADEVTLGVDFGTSYSSAAALVGGRMELVRDDGQPMIPSVVYFPSDSKPLVGHRATMGLDPTRIVTSIKRLMGRLYNDREVQNFRSRAACDIVATADHRPAIRVGQVEYRPETIAGLILARLRSLAEARFARPIRKAVIGIPESVSPEYLAAIHRAGELAELEIVQTLPEPMAAALALGLEESTHRRKVVVCDFGGGTFDATGFEQTEAGLVAVGGCGDPLLGGNDFDQVFATKIADLVEQKNQYRIADHPVQWQKLLCHCETAKRILSQSTHASLRVNHVYAAADGLPANIHTLVQRNWIEPHWEPLVARSLHALQQLIALPSWAPDQVDEVVLIGGTAMMPVVRNHIARFFNRDSVVTNEWANLAVVTGLALQAATPMQTNPGPRVVTGRRPQRRNGSD